MKDALKSGGERPFLGSMVTSDNWLAEMRRVLEEERNAIRRVDAKRVEEAARAKEALLAAITTGSPSEADKKTMLEGLAEVREELKRNLVLLVHARDCVREAITRGRPNGTMPGARLSIQL